MRQLLSNRLFVAILCFVLLFKALVPVGYMPDLQALQQGVFTITICSSYGSKSIVVDRNQKPIEGQQQNSNHKLKQTSDFCPFAGLHAAAMPVMALLLVLLLLGRQRRLFKEADRIKTADFSVAWPRGPPVHLA